MKKPKRKPAAPARKKKASGQGKPRAGAPAEPVSSPAERLLAGSEWSESTYTPEKAALVIDSIKASYSPALARLMILKVQTVPKSVEQICAAHPELPSRQTIYNWLAVNEEFAAEFVRAMALRALLFSEEMLHMSLDDSRDYLEEPQEDGTVKRVPDPARIARVRLIIDSLKWYIPKLLPKLFGDKPPLEPKVEEEAVKTYHVPALRPIEGPAEAEPPAPRKKKGKRRG